MNAPNRRRVVGIDSAPADGQDCAKRRPLAGVLTTFSRLSWSGSHIPSASSARYRRISPQHPATTLESCHVVARAGQNLCATLKWAPVYPNAWLIARFASCEGETTPCILTNEQRGLGITTASHLVAGVTSSFDLIKDLGKVVTRGRLHRRERPERLEPL